MNYHLCSATTLAHMRPDEVSNPFRSGYDSDNESYYVARFDEEDATRYYDEVIQPYNDNSRSGDIDFWFRSCSPGTMDVSGITLKACRELGLFRAIERTLDLTQLKNRALCIYNLAQQFGCTPVEFINKVSAEPATDDTFRDTYTFTPSKNKRFTDVKLDFSIASEREWNGSVLSYFKEQIAAGSRREEDGRIIYEFTLANKLTKVLQNGIVKGLMQIHQAKNK